MRLAAALALVLIVPAARADPARTLVDSFVRALTSDDPFEVTSLGDADDRWKLTTFTAYLHRYECISVNGYRFDRTNAETIHLDLDAAGVSRGASHRKLELPSSWVLDVVCDAQHCRLRRVEREELHAARLLILSHPADWSRVETPADFDPATFAREITNAIDVVGYEQRDYRFALDGVYAYALAVARRSGDRSAEARVWSETSFAEGMFGNQGTALEMAKASIAAADASGNADAMAIARFRMGITQWNMATPGNNAPLEEAARWLGAAAEMADQLDEPRTAIQTLYMKGYVERLRGDLRDFLLDSERVIQWSHRYHWPEGAAAASLAIAALHATTNDSSAALQSFRDAYRYALEARHESYANEAFCNIAILRVEAGDRSAVADLERLGRLEPGSANFDTAIELSRFLIENGRLAEADKLLTPFLRMAHDVEPSLPAVQFELAMSRLRLLQGRPKEALVLADSALADEARMPVETLDSSPWEVLLAKGKALAALGRPQEAVGSFREAVTAVETERKTQPNPIMSARFFEARVEPYRLLIDLLVRRGRTREAFDYAERMKGRALLDALAHDNVDYQAGLTEQERDEERRLTQELAGANKAALAQNGNDASVAQIRPRITAARAALDRFQARMDLAHPIRNISRADPIGKNRRFPRELRNGVVLEYVVGEHRTILFAVSPSGVVAHSIPVTKKQLQERVQLLERRIAQRDLRWRQSAGDLSALLFPPLEEASAICVIPDDVLWQVPFQLLLADRAPVFYAPSLSMLEVPLRHTKPVEGEWIAFGNPAVVHDTRDRIRALTRDARLGDLPEAETEVHAINALYKREKTRIYLRGAARESAFKREAPRFRILHLAAHGILDDHSPMYSAIVLAATPDESDDGLLEAREILRLHIDSELAVLASCDTAKGHIGAGEGVIGMSWAFLVAGCPTTVVSQWKADSKATEALMVEFYRHLRAGEAPAAALRQAQMTIRANPRYEDPLYWAPFIVVGSGMRQLSR